MSFLVFVSPKNGKMSFHLSKGFKYSHLRYKFRGNQFHRQMYTNRKDVVVHSIIFDIVASIESVNKVHLYWGDFFVKANMIFVAA